MSSKEKILKVDRYEVELNPRTHKVEYYAICGKKKISLPPAFADMYTEEYLEIMEVFSDRPEVLGIESSPYWAPRRTS